MRSSVVIPTHNRADILSKTLNCLAKGSAVPDEVIIVDDASPVPVQETLNPIQGLQLRFIRFEENKGAAAARNAGLRAAKAHTVLLMDDDVWADYDMLKYHLYFHEKYPHEGYAVQGRVIFDPEMTRTILLHYLEEYGPYRAMLYHEEGARLVDGVVTANISLKRAFLNKEKLFDEGFPFNRNEDTEFGVRMIKYGLDAHFHNGPSARHHAYFDVESYWSNLAKAGVGKGYWVRQNPDDSAHGLLLETCLRMCIWKDCWRDLAQNFRDSLDDNIQKIDVRECSVAVIAAFSRFFILAETWEQRLAMLEYWCTSIPGFQEGRDELARKLSQLSWGRKSLDPDKLMNGDPALFPIAWTAAELLEGVGKYRKALRVMEPFKDGIWATLKRGQLLQVLGRTSESRQAFESVLDRTGHGKGVEVIQRRRARAGMAKMKMYTPTLNGQFEGPVAHHTQPAIQLVKSSAEAHSLEILIEQIEAMDWINKWCKLDYTQTMSMENLKSIKGKFWYRFTRKMHRFKRQIARRIAY